MDKIDGILKERNKVHGSFAKGSLVATGLKDMILNNWVGYRSPAQQEAISQICSKLSRISCGDSMHPDHWIDIAGYATLALNLIGSWDVPEQAPLGADPLGCDGLDDQVPAI